MPTRDEILQQQRERLKERLKERIRESLEPKRTQAAFPAQETVLVRQPLPPIERDPLDIPRPNTDPGWYLKAGRPRKKDAAKAARRRGELQGSVEERLARLSLAGNGPVLTLRDVVQGLTLTEISTMAGLSLAEVSRVLRGQRKPSYEVGLRLSLVLGIDPFELCAFLVRQRLVYLRFGNRPKGRGTGERVKP